MYNLSFVDFLTQIKDCLVNLSSNKLDVKMAVSGQVFVITGSAQGLGKAFAVRLLTAGAKVCISDLKLETGEKTLVDLREKFGSENVCFEPCDVTDEEQFKNLFDKAEEFFNVSCIDVLVNNAGINTNLGWRKCMEVNILAVMMGTEIAMDRMRNSGKKGQIINVASMAGFGPGINMDMTGYTVSKTGVVALTRTMAKHIARHGVVTKCICPSWTDTEMVSSARSKGDVQKSMKEFKGMMTPEHVAEGFYRLVTECENGSAMAVMKDVPYMLVPDYNVFPMIMSMALVAKLFGKVMEPKVVTANHHIMAFIIMFFLFSAFVASIF